MAFYQSLPSPPPASDPRFEDWLKQLHQRVTRDDIVDTVRTITVAPSSGISNTETIVVGGNGNTRVYAHNLKVGTTIRVLLYGTCTSSAANASTFRIRFGAAGTTSDGVLASAATAAAATTGTAIPFRVEIVFTVRTVGTAATLDGKLNLQNSGITGIATVVSQTINLTSTTIDTTVDSWLSVSYVAAANTTTSTFQNGIIEVVKP